MSSSQIKLVTPSTKSEELKIDLFPWDVEVNGVPYQVARLEGFVHSIGGRRGENDLWMWPRGEEPMYENLLEFQCDGSGVCWGICYEPHNYIKSKYDESECFTSGGAMITRNGKYFYFCRGGIDQARYILTSLIDDHPMDLHEYEYDKKVIGRKVWWRSEPAIIKSWIGHGQACVMLEPDTSLIERFSMPAEYVEEDDCMLNDPETTESVKADIFDAHIWWFRE